MIDLFTHGTPNGIKIAIALEEMGLPYRAHIIDVFAGESHTSQFRKMNPAGKIPVIRDTETNSTIYESNAILMYLADKSGRLAPADTRAKLKMTQLLFLQASLQGPMFGQRAHFSMFGPEIVPYAIRRYEEQGDVVDALVEDLLEGREFFLDEFSIVDISFFGWYLPANRSGFLKQDDSNLRHWFDRVAARPAVRRGVAATPEIPLPPRRRA